MVHGCQKRVVGAGSLHMLGLHRGCRGVLLVGRSLFLSSRAGGNSTSAAVIADMVHRGDVDYGFVVNIVNVRDVHIIHRGVVEEGAVIPISASVTDTAIAEAVVDAAIEADLRAPVAAIPGECIAAPAPVAGSPEQASLRRCHPRTRHPEITFIAIGPVAGRPQITIGGGHGLLVHRQRGRSHGDRHGELRESDGRYGQYQKS